MPTESEIVIAYKKTQNNYQPNHITESRQQFSEFEKKIMTCVVNQLGLVAKDWSNKDVKFLIPVREITGGSKNHARVRAAAESIQNKRIILTNKATGGQNDLLYHSIIPFPEVEIRTISGIDYLGITMFSAVVPNFIELGSQFTKYSIEVMLSLNSNYSQRLYEIIMLHSSRKEYKFKYTVENLKFMLNCPESYNLDDLKSRALKPAQAEIFLKAQMEITFEPSKKEGRKILEFEFTIKTQKHVQEKNILNDIANFAELEQYQKNFHLIRLLNEYNFTVKQQEAIMFDPKKLTEFIIIDSEIYHGKRAVENRTAYMAKSLGFAVKSEKTNKIVAKKAKNSK